MINRQEREREKMKEKIFQKRYKIQIIKYKREKKILNNLYEKQFQYTDFGNF